MPKTKFVRIATSGPTIDGRQIEANWLTQAAKNYNPATYAARGNIEHIRGVTGEKPFRAVADVISLKAENVTVDLAGKSETRVGLFAELDVTQDLVDLNKDDQKLYTSIEIIPEFAGTKEAYMVGLAFTDSPASLGTDRLQFTAHAKAFGAFVSAPAELTLDLVPPAAPTEVESFMSGLKSFLTGLAPKPNEAPAPIVVTQPAISPTTSQDLSAFAGLVSDGFAKMTAAIEASSKASAAATKAVAEDLAALKSQVEKTPTNQYTPRQPTSGGGDQANLADF